jgi:uncharacterized protein (TIGR03435 family)
MVSRSCLFVVSLVVTALPCRPQPTVMPSFEVASVRRGVPPASQPPSRGGPGTNDPSRITFSGVNLVYLIWPAFDIEPERIEGPAWIRDLRGNTYFITATMAPETTKQQLHLMLQNLLRERFGLRVHRETRSLPGFELTSVPGGPKLSEWTAEPVPDEPIPLWSEDREGFPVLAKGRTGCTYGGWSGATAALKVTCRRSMADFAQDLGRFIKLADGSPREEAKPEVLDKTGLPGIYEFRFVFEGTINPRSGAGVSSDPTGAPSLFSALQKQLGLRLVKAGNLPVTFLVVDNAEQTPTEN